MIGGKKTIFYTPLVTPIPATAVPIVQSHQLGNSNFYACLEFVCLIAEQNYLVGDVIQVTAQWTGAASSPKSDWKSNTQVGATLSASTDFLAINKLNGSAFTPTKTSWAYRFALLT